MEITKKHNSAHPARSGRNGNIDLMRFVFCLIIILYQINNRLDLNPPFGLSEKYFSFCGEGRIGVEFFFIVSGYLLAVTAKKNYSTNSIVTSTNPLCIAKRCRFFRIICSAILSAWHFGFIFTVCRIQGRRLKNCSI